MKEDRYHKPGTRFNKRLVRDHKRTAYEVEAHHHSIWKHVMLNAVLKLYSSIPLSVNQGPQLPEMSYQKKREQPQLKKLPADFISKCHTEQNVTLWLEAKTIHRRYISSPDSTFRTLLIWCNTRCIFSGDTADGTNICFTISYWNCITDRAYSRLIA